MKAAFYLPEPKQFVEIKYLSKSEVFQLFQIFNILKSKKIKFDEIVFHRT